MVIQIGLVGAGVMGGNHARIVAESGRSRLRMVFDTNQGMSERVASQWNSQAARTVDELEACDALIIASSTGSHFDLASRFIAAGKPVLIEKPLGINLDQTKEIIRSSEASNVPLMCGFVERFNPALITACRMISEPVRHVSTYRHSPHNPRASSSVVTDLLIHDLDLTWRLAPNMSEPTVGAAIWKPSSNAFAEIADCTLQFGDQMTAIQSASRWGQRKIREIKILTDELLLEIDLLRVTVTAYRHRSQSADALHPATYRAETMIDVPFIRHSGEPLALQLEHFIDLVQGVSDPDAERASLLGPHLLAELVEPQ